MACILRNLLRSAYIINWLVCEYDIDDVIQKEASVSNYVEAKDNREVVDITQLNAELRITVAKIDQLRADIDAIVTEIEGEEA